MSVLALNPEEDKLVDQVAELSDILEGDVDEARLVGASGVEIILPPPIYELLRYVADALTGGNGVMIMPVNKLMTTNQAAELLNVSRPYLVKLLKEKLIPFEYVGSHRRIRLADLLTYREDRDRDREEALTEMVRRSEEAELPY